MLIRPSGPPPLLKLAHYLILESRILGKGLNSVVYQGVNTISGQHVAIKRIALVDQLQHKLAINQLSCLKTIAHPQILRYHFDFHTKSAIYIVTELCEETLFSRLIRHRKFAQKEAVQIFTKILAGYQEIRRKGYLHRDLKPQNIFLRLGEIKIGDFGFSIQAKSNDIRQSVNVGTPLYMAPQVIQQNIYSQKSDIWSLGVLLYEMLHRKVPFSSKKEKELILEMKSASIKFDCHPGLQKILKKCLDVDKDKRFSLKDLQSAIGKFLFDENKVDSLQKLSNEEKKIANELQYITLMEYIQNISSKCPRNDCDERIKYLFQYTIRMRLKIVEALQSQSPLKDGLLKTEATQMKARHSSAPMLPEGLNETDRLRFLDCNEANFNYFTLWYIQAQLKEILREKLEGLKAIDSQEKVAKNQDHLRLTDFLLTAYVLNRMLIESEDCLQSFTDILQFGLILLRPQRFSLHVCRAIQQKGEELRIS